MFHLTLLLICGLVAYAGTSKHLISPKVIGGTAAFISSYPYLVSIHKRGGLLCGGTIYNSRYIVTAAHCIKNINSPTELTIRYGSTDWNFGGKLIGVVNTKMHPSYSPTNNKYDIALLKTSERIIADTNVRSVYLAKEEPENNVTAQIVGWGTQKHGEKITSTNLYAAEVKIIKRSECNSDKYRYRGAIKSTMLCAAAMGVDTCQGDSGGPLMIGGVQVGIVSWGRKCGSSHFPGVYSSVADLRDFVITNAK